MSDTTIGMRRKIKSAGDLQSVVRAMKALASSNIAHYERAAASLAEYYSNIQLGLGLSLRAIGTASEPENDRKRSSQLTSGIIIFGSDQGLVGRFNDVIADYALSALADKKRSYVVWAVGERVYTLLADAGVPPATLYAVPSAISGVTGLVGQLLVDLEASQTLGTTDEILLFYNRLSSKTMYKPVERHLLPLNEDWRRRMSAVPWPTGYIPEVVGSRIATLQALIHEFLFVSLFRACAESLASENASRLAAMQRADKNIDELLDELNHTYHRLRQSSIDSELFDVISGFEAIRRGIGH